MASLTLLNDVGHFWGGDLLLSASGDLSRVDTVMRSRQRVLRRLMTNPGDYTSHTNYGGGLPRRIGQRNDPKEIAAIIRQQMRLEASVSQDPEPQITVTEIVNGVSCAVVYTVLPDLTPTTLAFDLNV